jgi:hypothetical protein
LSRNPKSPQLRKEPRKELTIGSQCENILHMHQSTKIQH